MTDPAPAARSRGPLGYGLLALAVAIAVGVGIYLFLSPGSDDDASPAAATTQTGVLAPERPEIGQLAPDFALVDVRDGKTVRKLSDYRGKVVVVNWFASWCKPCANEIPAFLEARAILGDQVVFFGVDYAETRARAASFLDGFGADYPAVLDSSGAVADHYRVSGLPVTAFVDRDGILRALVPAEMTHDRLEENFLKVGITYKAP